MAIKRLDDYCEKCKNNKVTLFRSIKCTMCINNYIPGKKPREYEEKNKK